MEGGGGVLGFPYVDLSCVFGYNCYPLRFETCDFSLSRRLGFWEYLMVLVLGGYCLSQPLLWVSLCLLLTSCILEKVYFPCLWTLLLPFLFMSCFDSP